jgi:hypothetical protein
MEMLRAKSVSGVRVVLKHASPMQETFRGQLLNVVLVPAATGHEYWSR